MSVGREAEPPDAREVEGGTGRISGLDLFDRPSTADTGARNNLDYYETPRFMVKSLLHHHPILRDALILEPCAGDGAISRTLTECGYPFVLTNDIDTRHPVRTHCDATLPEFWRRTEFSQLDYVITNPTYEYAFSILQHAVVSARVAVVMLLRKTFVEPTGVLERPKPTDRGPWFANHPPTRIIGQPRHRFRGRGTDACASDWFIWERQPDRSLPPMVIDHLSKTRT